MYEDQTYEAILQRMLDSVPLDLDKREGSIIYDALAPAAAELAEAYIELDNVLILGFADTTNGEWLDRRTSELGVDRKQATKAIREGTFNISVEIGERFFISDLYFVVIAGGTTAQLECESSGTIGNDPTGELLPVNNISGLTSAELGAVLIPGGDTETDQTLLERYLEQIRKPSTSGNAFHYLEWAKEVQGVGDAKVFPLWNGNGTVKVVIVDSTTSPASVELVTNVQNYIDPNGGTGEGAAPIGSTVTVESASTKLIDISVTLILAEGKALPDAQTEIETALDDYLRSLAFKETIVRYAQIGTIILNAESVIDYSNLLINSGTANVELLETEIPVRGMVNLIE
jgi:uncharacterized phage protein gp47/JayE